MAKRNFIITVVFMYFLIIASTSFAVDKYQWKLADTEDGQIYTSVVAGRDYVTSKATYVIPAFIL